MEPGFIPGTILSDWNNLLDNERVLESTSYLHQNGSPVLALCGTLCFTFLPAHLPVDLIPFSSGVGFPGSGQQPAMLRWLLSELRKRTPGGLYIVLGGTHAQMTSLVLTICSFPVI